jgi:hypothetical protein
VAAGRKSLGEFAVDAYNMSAQLPAAMAGATAKAAAEVTNSARDEIRKDSGGDMVLSGMGAKVGARYDIKGGDNPTALIRATGPLHILESDTSQHIILPGGVGRAQGRSRVARRAAKQDLYNALFGGSVGSGATPLRTPYGPRYRVNHPGTTGKKTWSRAIERAIPKVPKTYQDALNQHLRKYFG